MVEVAIPELVAHGVLQASRSLMEQGVVVNIPRLQPIVRGLQASLMIKARLISWCWENTVPARTESQSSGRRTADAIAD